MNLALILVGLFYLLGGLLVLRGAATERLLDLALARLTMEPVDPQETRRVRKVAWIGGLTGASGAALAVLSPWSPWLFALSAVAQWLGGGPEEAASRRASTLYLLVAAAVAAAAWTGTLRAWPAEVLPALGELAGLAAVPGLVAFLLFRRLAV